MSPEIHVIVASLYMTFTEVDPSRTYTSQVRDGAIVDTTVTFFAKFDRHGFYQRRCIGVYKLYMTYKLSWLALNYKN